MNAILIEKQGYRLLKNASLRKQGKRALNAQKLNKKWEKEQKKSRADCTVPFPDHIVINDSTFGIDMKSIKSILDREGIEYFELPFPA